MGGYITTRCDGE